MNFVLDGISIVIGYSVFFCGWNRRENCFETIFYVTLNTMI
jgi:hypothetical protein